MTIKKTLRNFPIKEMGAAFLAEAALAIVVMADPLASDVWIEDAAIASIMIQLRVEDLGLEEVIWQSASVSPLQDALRICTRGMDIRCSCRWFPL